MLSNEARIIQKKIAHEQLAQNICTSVA
jgi:hypothetical protein